MHSKLSFTVLNDEPLFYATSDVNGSVLFF